MHVRESFWVWVQPMRDGVTMIGWVHTQNYPWCTRFINPHIIGLHDDVIKWKHFPRYWLFVRGIHRSPLNSPHNGQWRGTFMFSLIGAWINGWVNNREAGDLRRHRAHYDVTCQSSNPVGIMKSVVSRRVVLEFCVPMYLVSSDPLHLPGYVESHTYARCRTLR